MRIARGRCRASRCLLIRAGERKRSDLRVRAPLAAAIGAAALVGCAVCHYDDYVTSPTASIPTPTRSGTRIPLPDRTTHPARQKAEPIARERVPILKPQNEAKFVVLQDIEVVGRSRSYTGEQSDPDNCAERCLADKGCDAFSFERETKLCYLVRQITDLNSNASFVSGRLR